MRTLAQTVYLDSTVGALDELPRAGTALENPYVFHDAALEIRAMAAQGKVEITHERAVRIGNEDVVDQLHFRRLR